eukprot:2135771-Rhodomonas_salina.7
MAEMVTTNVMHDVLALICRGCGSDLERVPMRSLCDDVIVIMATGYAIRITSSRRMLRVHDQDIGDQERMVRMHVQNASSACIIRVHAQDACPRCMTRTRDPYCRVLTTHVMHVEQGSACDTSSQHVHVTHAQDSCDAGNQSACDASSHLLAFRKPLASLEQLLPRLHTLQPDPRRLWVSARQHHSLVGPADVLLCQMQA